MGQVIDGMDVLDKMEKIPVGTGPDIMYLCRLQIAAKCAAKMQPVVTACRSMTAGAQDRPTQEIRLTRVEIHANPMAG